MNKKFSLVLLCALLLLLAVFAPSCGGADMINNIWPYDAYAGSGYARPTILYFAGHKWNVIGEERDVWILHKLDNQDTETWDEAIASCNTMYDSFTPAEQAMVVPVSTADKEYKWVIKDEENEEKVEEYIAAESPLTDANLFLLSASEAATYLYHWSSEYNYTWLRSTEKNSGEKVRLFEGLPPTIASADEKWYAQPVFQMDRTRILFYTEDNTYYYFDKPFHKPTADEGFMPFDYRDIDSLRYADHNITILDDSRTGFTASVDGSDRAAVQASGSITISYDGAFFKENEYVSVLLCAPGGEILYYAGSPTSDQSGRGELTLSLPEELPTGNYLLRVFNELRKPSETDEASPFCDIALTVTPTYPGSGTQSDPYILSDLRDLTVFRQNVNAGVDSNAWYKLADDFSNSGAPVTVPVGTEDTPFRGIFDGNGQTIDIDITDTSREGTALFRVIEGATIRNLTVRGSVTGANYAGGLVGIAKNCDVLIENCLVSASVSVPEDNAAHVMGGVIGYSEDAAVTLRNVIFSGSLQAPSAHAGGLLGYGLNRPVIVEHCLFNGSHSGSLFNPVCFNSWVTVFRISDSYTTLAASKLAGGTFYYQAIASVPVLMTEAPENRLFRTMSFTGQDTFFLPASVQDVEPEYLYTGSAIDVHYTVTADNTLLTEGTDYTVTVSPATVCEKGQYTLTFTGQGAFLGSSQVIQFTVSDGQGISSWSALQDAFNAGGNYRLTADVTPGSGEGTLDVPGGRSVVLDLNGHTIDRGLSEKIINGVVIRVNGSLTLQDSVGTGAVTGGKSSNNGGGGVRVNKGGEFVLSGGSIRDNYSARGGGVLIEMGARMAMTGGSICGNGGKVGGGVCIEGSFRMIGGSFSGNDTLRYGAVFVDEQAEFFMTGGSITGNTSSRTDKPGFGGVVVCNETAVFKLAGSPVIENNTNAFGERCNVCLSEYQNMDTPKIILGGPLSAGARIGVTTVSRDVFTAGLPGNGTLSNFFGDTAERAVLQKNGEAALDRGLYSITVESSAHGVVQAVSQAYEEDLVQLSVFPEKGYAAAGITLVMQDGSEVTMKEDSTFIMPAGHVIVSASFSAGITVNTAEGEQTCLVLTPETTELTAPWYAVTESMTISDRLIVRGGSGLFLCDGVLLTCDGGIDVSAGNTLVIDGEGSGELHANHYNHDDGACIGGGEYQDAGSIFIRGGIIHADVNSRYTNGSGAAIGGGTAHSGGRITISGGTVLAVASGSRGAAIGGGGSGSSGIITISGGMVTAEASSGAAIGAGAAGDKRTYGVIDEINISGGRVNARSSGAGAIGTGYCSYPMDAPGRGGVIHISGGQITANGFTDGDTYGHTGYGPGIGCGQLQEPVEVILEWSDEHDYLEVNRYAGKITFVEGKPFRLYGTRIPATLENINGAKIVPADTEIYEIAFDTENGTVTADPPEVLPSDAAAGQTVQLSLFPDYPYELDSLTVTDELGESVPVADDFTFSMPMSSVTVHTVFTPIPAVQVSTTEGSVDAIPVRTYMTGCESGWYAVTEDTVLPERLDIRGNVKLYLSEGTTFTCIKGIHVCEGNSLTIEGGGTLVAGNEQVKDLSKRIDRLVAGIGGNDHEAGGTITIRSGNIRAYAGQHGAAIGGGNLGEAGTITILGGNVQANTSGFAAAIGTGVYSQYADSGNPGGTIVIRGGTVTATTESGNAAIGSSAYGKSVSIIIDGGHVTACSPVADDYICGIGGKYTVSPCSITLGWSSESDFIDCVSYEGDVRFADGKQFRLTDRTAYATASNISGEKIVPYTGPSYTVTAESGNGTVVTDEFGTVTPDAVTAMEGQVIALAIEPAHLYRFKSLSVTERVSGNPVSVADDFTFVMPAADVCCNAVFELIPAVRIATSEGSVDCVDIMPYMVDWSAGWYAVTKDTAIDERVTVHGTVKLYLCEGVTLTCRKGIEVRDENTFIVEGQGTLIADASGTPNASGIGSSDGACAGPIIIRSGTITATGYGDSDKHSSLSSAGIGGGGNYGCASTIRIYGGNITAVSGVPRYGDNYPAGIGGSYYGKIGSIEIYGGTICSYGGIGASYYDQSDSSVSISGGKITVPRGYIGSGYGLFSNSNNGIHVSLSWSDEDDYIDAPSFQGDIEFPKDFTLQSSGALANAGNISGERLVPYAGGDEIYNIFNLNDNGRISVNATRAFAGQLITVKHHPEPPFVISKLSIYGETISGPYGDNPAAFVDIPFTAVDATTFTFVMPERNVSVAAAFNEISELLQGGGSEESPYLIRSASDWSAFRSLDDAGLGTNQTYFRLEADISVTERLVSKWFEGHFDGGGHTLNVNLSGGESAPFGNLFNASIRNLKVTGTIDDYECGGLADYVDGQILIENCEIAVNMVNHAERNSAVFVYGSGWDMKVRNVIFSGDLASTGGTLLGGVATQARAEVENCLDLSSSKNWLVNRSNLGNISETNVYYTTPRSQTTSLGGCQQAYTLAGSDTVRLTLVGETGLQWQGIIYAAEGEEIRFKAERTDGGTQYGLILTADSLEPQLLEPDDQGVYTLTMPAMNVDMNRATLSTAYEITFVNYDGTVLQSGLAPLYVGRLPFRPVENGSAWRFTGWTPQVVTPPTGNATYTASYISVPTLQTGLNTLSLTAGQEETWAFVPEADGDYCFSSAGQSMNIDVTVRDDQDEIIATGCEFLSGTEIFRCIAVGLEANRFYTLSFSSVNRTGPVNVRASAVTAHGVLPINSNQSLGVIDYDSLAYTGQRVSIQVTPEDYYELARLVVTGKNNEPVESDGADFIMPDFDVLVRAEYRRTLDSLLDGRGTQNDPLKITSASDWNTVAEWIADGGDTRGMVFRLTGDIRVAASWGTETSPFRGVFNGSGSTLNVTLESENGYCAPFCCIDGASIRNLKVTGSVSGGKHSAGLVGYAQGSCLIENCDIRTDIYTESNYCGGVVGNGGSAAVTLSSCVFSGSLSGADRTATLWGWSETGAAPTLINCLDLSGSTAPIGLGYGSVRINNTYYTAENKTSGTARIWTNRGSLARRIYGAEGVLIPHIAEGSGLDYDGSVYAAEGEQISITTTRAYTSEREQGLVLKGSAMETLRLVPDENGIFSYIVPECSVVVYPGQVLRFCNDDGTLLKQDIYYYYEMAAYTGETPVKPADARHIYTFADWSPELHPVDRSVTTYTAVYDITPILYPGENQFGLKLYKPVDCPFTPPADGTYRFWVESDTVHPQITILDETETQIASGDSYSGRLEMIADLQAGKPYTVRVESLFGNGNITLNIESVVMHSITIDPNHDHGTVESDPGTWVGQMIPIIVIPDEGYGIAEITVNRNSDGAAVPEYEPGLFIMPDDDVTVHVRFTQAYPIVFEPVEHRMFDSVLIDGLGGIMGMTATAVPGAKIEVVFITEEGWMPNGASVTTARGAAVPFSMGRNWTFSSDGIHAIRFIMPAEGVTVTAPVCEFSFRDPDFSLPAALTQIEDEAFEGIMARVVYIPDTCRSIGSHAFRNCPNLYMVRIPTNCQIGTDAFDGYPGIYIFGTPNSWADTYCRNHDNCTFIPETNN